MGVDRQANRLASCIPYILMSAELEELQSERAKDKYRGVVDAAQPVLLPPRTRYKTVPGKNKKKAFQEPAKEVVQHRPATDKEAFWRLISRRPGLFAGLFGGFGRAQSLHEFLKRLDKRLLSKMPLETLALLLRCDKFQNLRELREKFDPPPHDSDTDYEPSASSLISSATSSPSEPLTVTPRSSQDAHSEPPPAQIDSLRMKLFDAAAELNEAFVAK